MIGKTVLEIMDEKAEIKPESVVLQLDTSVNQGQGMKLKTEIVKDTASEWANDITPEEDADGRKFPDQCGKLLEKVEMKAIKVKRERHDTRAGIWITISIKPLLRER